MSVSGAVRLLVGLSGYRGAQATYFRACVRRLSGQMEGVSKGEDDVGFSATGRVP